jgi:tripartite-type tricarboxylate transporter receptor subunit TctC
VKFAAVIALSAAFFLPATGAHSQTFPSKPVRIVIGFVPGGSIDVVSRLIAPRLSDALGQPVIVDNRPGANGVLATELVAKSPPDGHTVFMGTLGNLAVNPSVYPNLPFSIERDLVPVTQVASLSLMLVAHPSVPYTTVSELIAYANAHPGQVNYSSSGNGGTTHLAGELFNLLAGVRTQHVPYRGSTPATNDLFAGQVQITYDTVASALPFVTTNRLRAIAVTSPRRQPALPNVPTISETLPGYGVVNWFGMMVPAGTPPEIIERLRTETLKALNVAEIQDRMAAMGIEPVGSSSEEFRAFLRAEIAKWARVVRDANIRAD